MWWGRVKLVWLLGISVPGAPQCRLGPHSPGSRFQHRPRPARGGEVLEPRTGRTRSSCGLSFKRLGVVVAERHAYVIIAIDGCLEAVLTVVGA